MNRSVTLRLLVMVSLLMLAAAAGLTVYTAQQADVARSAMMRRAQDLDALSDVRAELAVYESAYSAFDMCQAAPAPLATLISESLPAGQAPGMRDLSEDGPTGWKRRRFELSFDQASIADAIAFARVAEAPVRDGAGHERPGWRVVKCAIRPVPGRPGIGRVVLVLEALVRE